MSNGQVRMQWKSAAGRMYRVEGSTAFDVADWVAVSGDIRATGATTGWTNVVPADVPMGFYRIRRIE
jgi:hypothetical protein